MKPIAPYGQYLFNTIDSEQNPVAIIFLGKYAAKRALEFQYYIPDTENPYLPYTLYLPNRSSPNNYKWPIRNCDVYLIDTGESSTSFIRFCAKHFLYSGGIVVKYYSGLNKKPLIFKKRT
jgi:hypothetical protein